MITVANRIMINPDYNEAVEARFAGCASQVEQMEGFVSLESKNRENNCVHSDS